MSTAATQKRPQTEAAQFADRHNMPPPERWVEWVSEVSDRPEVDERHALCSQYLAKLR
jgi:hypothetical protein